MKVLLNWLRQFAPIDREPDELAQVMNTLGMAVEEMAPIGELDGVVVGRVAGLRSHPEADRIQLVDVELGAAALDDAPDHGGAAQICCGAFNMSVGDLVPVATVGTTMPDGMKIERRTMRGEPSHGMCCSAAEIGLGDDHEGILILPDGLEVGAPLMSQLGLAGDVLFDLEVNPNRPDAMSVAGVARDLAAALGVPFAIPTPAVAESTERAGDALSVNVADPTLCGRFVAKVVRDVAVRTSPLWMQMRLRLCGMRPINSVVDASNYVMLELGTPSHAFDLALLPEGKLGTRRAVAGETLTTLDSQERTLVAGDGVIVDAHDQPIGIAGVMGGASTEISASTTAVAVEMAWWDPPSIAATSTRLGLRSEASIRFERGTDWALNPLALDRFCELLGDITPGGVQVCAGNIDEFGSLRSPEPIRVRSSRLSLLLGKPFTAAEAASLLEPIGFGAVVDGDEVVVTVPSFRPDVATETDVAEEVARHFGYENLGKTVPRSPHPGSLTRTQQLRRRLRAVMLGEGLSEAMPHPFLAADQLAAAGLRDVEPVKLLNPMTSDESVLRPSLLPGLLAAAAHNAAHQIDDVALFELGVVFGQPPANREADPHDPNVASLPDETERLGAIWCGHDAWTAVRTWHLLVAELGIDAALVNVDGAAGMHPNRAATIVLRDAVSDEASNVVVGEVGELHPTVCEAAGLDVRCAWLEVNATALMAAATVDTAKPYSVVSQFPSADVDLAFELPETVAASELEATLRAAGGDELRTLVLFDTFRGSQLPEGVRSLAYRLRLQASDRTLTDADVAAIRERCIAAAQDAHRAKLRT